MIDGIKLLAKEICDFLKPGGVIIYHICSLRNINKKFA